MDWIATFFTLLGALLVARKEYRGFAVGFLGNGMWAIWGVMNGVWSILTINVIFAAVNTYGILYWRKNQ